jgi:hypothetical protein
MKTWKALRKSTSFFNPEITSQKDSFGLWALEEIGFSNVGEPTRATIGISVRQLRE